MGGVSVPVFLRKHKAICDFPGGGSSDPLAFSGSTHDHNLVCTFVFVYINKIRFFVMASISRFIIIICIQNWS